GSAAPRWPECRGVRRLELLEDVDQLQGDDARAVRGMGGDPDAPVRRRDRLAPRGRVGAEVRGGDAAAERGKADRLTLGELAVVEVVEADARHALQRRRE